MTQRLEPNTIAGEGDPYASEAQEMLEEWLNAFKEVPGAQVAAAVELNSGAFSIENAAGMFEMTPETGDTDDLTTITGSFGTVGFDDQFIAIVPAAGKTITVKPNVGGDGKIYTASGNDVVLSGRAVMLLRARYGGGSNQWEEVTNSTSIARTSKLLGAEDITVLAIGNASEAIIPTLGMHQVDSYNNTSADDLKFIDPTNDVKLILLNGYSDSHVVTVRDYVASSVSGDGKISLADATDRILSTTRWILLRKTGAAGSVIWKEIPLGSNSSLPTIQTKSADFTAYPGYHYLVDCSTDVVATLAAGGSYIGQECTIEVVAGTGQCKVATTGSEKFTNSETFVTAQEIGSMVRVRAVQAYSIGTPQTYSILR